MKSKLSENAEIIAKARYFDENENWETCTYRVANTISQVEIERQKYREIFHEMIFNRDFIPAGRIMRNSGRSKGSLLNCYNIPIGDSIEEIGTCIADSLRLWSEGGGVGINFSPLRPKGDSIKGKGGESSGLVSFIEAIDHVSKTIESGGARRAAALGHVIVDHPEILEFIDAKMVHGKLSSFNISVAVTDEFLDAVEVDGDWEFKFAQKSYGKIKAKIIWDKIVTNMTNNAEPGLLNWSNFTVNNSYYFQEIIGTNPCGETTLGAYECCDLGSLVLPNYITGTSSTNWKKMGDVIKNAVRFLDDVLDVNKYSIQQIDINSHNSRRIGLGVMGLADYLFKKGVRYGSPKGIQEVEKLFKFLRDTAYQASIELAVEKGAFPKFDAVKYSKAKFIRNLPVSLRLDIKEKGIRNCTLLAMAPTGTVSLVADTNSGIEPLFCKAYKRCDAVSERIYVHPLYEEILLKDGHTPDYFVDTFDLKPEDHLETQAAIQKYVDGSVSKTINLPEETTPQDLSRLLLEYVRDLKGCTVYRDNCRPGQILNQLPESDVIEYLKSQGKIEHEQCADDVKCASGKCDL